MPYVFGAGNAASQLKLAREAILYFPARGLPRRQGRLGTGRSAVNFLRMKDS